MPRDNNQRGHREKLWAACAVEGNGRVICNLCGLEVLPGNAWDRSHVGASAAMGGTCVGIAHRRCNRAHAALIVVPMVAKMKRQRRKHLGIDAPGLAARPLPCGRRSPWKKKISGAVVRREP